MSLTTKRKHKNRHVYLDDDIRLMTLINLNEKRKPENIVTLSQFKIIVRDVKTDEKWL